VPRVALDTNVLVYAEGISQIFDAIILVAAAQARCDLLLSEDFHDGFIWGGVTVTNPFGASPDVRIAHMLAPPP
jgi:predicted nucleic acid-binding protein